MSPPPHDRPGAGTGVLVAVTGSERRLDVHAAVAAAPGLESVGVVGTVEAARALVAALEIDVVLVGPDLPGGAAGLVEELVARGSGARPVLLLPADAAYPASLPPDLDRVDDGAGAEELGRAVRAVVEGAVGGRNPGPPAPALELLSVRETQVAVRIARGLRNRDIAAELYIAENTVKNHVHRILEKLALSSRVEIATAALRAGLVDPVPADAEDAP